MIGFITYLIPEDEVTSAKIELTLYTRSECGLCDEMKEVVAALPEELNVTLKELDITSDAALEEKYILDIPLLFHGGRCLVKHTTNEKELLFEIGKLAENPTP